MLHWYYFLPHSSPALTILKVYTCSHVLLMNSPLLPTSPPLSLSPPPRLHEFTWHGSDPRDPSRFTPKGNIFQQLCRVPSQFYHIQCEGREDQERHSHRSEAHALLRTGGREHNGNISVLLAYQAVGTVKPPNKGHIGTRSFVLYREVSFIRRLKCTGVIGIGTSRFVLYREVLFIQSGLYWRFHCIWSHTLFLG